MSQTDPFQTANSWKHLLICPSQGIVKDVHQVFGGAMPQAQLLEIPVYPPTAGLIEVLGAQNPDTILADVISDRDRGLQLIKEISAISSRVSIIALISSNDTDLILKALRAGATEFLTYPFNVDQLKDCFSRLVVKNPSVRGSGKAGQVITVVPAKGACGASTVASGLIFHLKKKNSKTLLADLDPLTGTISFLLKMKSSFSFMDALSRAQSLDDDLWRSLTTVHSGIDVMLAPEQTVEGVHDLMDAATIIDYARWNYERAVVDIANPYGAWNLSVLRHSDEILLVSTNELPALQATQRALSYLEQNKVDRAKVKLVVNRYNRDVGLSKEVIETAIKCEVFQLLPSDFEGVQRAMIDGKPIPVSSPFGKGLVQLAEKLYGKEEIKPQKSSSWSLMSLFSRTSS